MNNKYVNKYISKNPYEFRKDIISQCKEMDKEDVYEWLIIDEREIYRLMQENQQLKDLIVEKNNQLKDIQNKHTDYTQVNILQMKLEESENARKKAIEFINNINDWEICSKYDCIYKDDVLDVLRILDIDKGE